MIVFLEGDKNDFTTYLNPPIKARSVRLVSCSLYNSWYNLISGFTGARSALPTGVATTARNPIPNSHYTPITLAKEIAKNDYTLTMGLPHEMTIKHATSGWNFMVDALNPLGELLGITGKNISTTPLAVKWKVPSSYEVHCNLVKSYSDGSPSNLMSKFPPRGNPFDLVTYEPIALSYDLSCDLISEINITIKVDGEVVDFNGRKINLVLSFT